MKLTKQGKQAIKWWLDGRQVEYRIDSLNIWVDLQGSNVLSVFCRDDVQFQIEKPKLKLKLVDMSKLPKGTMTNCKELVWGCDDFGYFLQDGGRYLHDADWGDVRIAEQKTFTYWGGGECPVPDGLRVEVVYRRNELATAVASHLEWRHLDHGDDIIGYRILSVFYGWTDDPSKAK